MVYITSIPIITPNIFKRRPNYTHQNGNINPTSYLRSYRIPIYKHEPHELEPEIIPLMFELKV